MSPIKNFKGYTSSLSSTIYKKNYSKIKKQTWNATKSKQQHFKKAHLMYSHSLESKTNRRKHVLWPWKIPVINPNSSTGNSALWEFFFLSMVENIIWQNLCCSEKMEKELSNVLCESSKTSAIKSHFSFYRSQCIL